MKGWNKIITCFVVVLSFCSCGRMNRERDKRQILAILANERLAHYSRNAALFADEFADSVYQISSGKVEHIAKQEVRRHVANYFASSRIIKWADTDLPVINFSADGSLAYAIVRKLVITRLIGNNDARPDSTTFAWVSIYSKSAKGWQLVCNVSTNK